MIGKLPLLAGELLSVLMIEVQNPLEALCSQGQVELQAGINLTLRMVEIRNPLETH